LDVERGRVSAEDIWLDLRHEPHFPDGVRLAPTGDRVVIAFYHPGDVVDGLVRQYRLADGAIEKEWRVPGSPRVTCANFVEIDGAVKLLITTADEGMPVELRARCPEAGSLFLADTEFTSPLSESDLVEVDAWMNESK
jgi:sugar lactone lactonase YvrE